MPLLTLSAPVPQHPANNIRATQSLRDNTQKIVWCVARRQKQERHPGITTKTNSFIKLLTQTERGDEVAVTLHILGTQVVKQTAALTDQLEQPTAAVVVLLVNLKVVSEVVDALGEQRDLDLRRASVPFGATKLLDDLRFNRSVQWHRLSF